MQIRDIMHRAEYVPGGISVAAAARLMDRKKLDSVLVEHDGQLGIMTERDILRKVAAQGLDAAKVTVAGIMSGPLKTISGDGYVEDASELMEKYGIRRLVVTEHAEIVGVVNAACIARNVRYLTAQRLSTAHSGQSFGAIH